ncbi:broad-complex core protein isoforms 1/2/3/4/5 [Drosophila kikkawai]|uniref:Broad-complex core protein isoforms 1/2/3/4/5 n=1 Tax=Drosophila kikkawai TaxID=30033 RepID=A0A6P4IVF1_DROKI|nr:uncharacterized protein LOC108077516 [Drosophila kikkawai]
MAAENYHLKWDSHLSYLNSSIATLYKNEKFADVVLYSSYNSSGIPSDIPTVGISAHKFILSASSQFFATMFETAPITAPNGVLYVVLPPDLSHRAIQILVQYMYSGEATVSNDILNEVLRGGEILKIRGLCRTSASNGGGSVVSTSHHTLGGHLHSREASAMYMSNGTRSAALPPPPPPPPISDHYSSKPGGSTRFALEHHHHLSSHHNHLSHHHQQQQFRGLGASVMPKDSPVIIKSPKMAAHTGLLTVASSSKLGISVNKEVAIDPEDKCCFAGPGQVEPQAHPPPPTSSSTTAGGGGGGGGTIAAGASASQPISICTEVGCSSCPMAPGPSTEQSETSLRRTEYEEQALRERNEVGLVFERRLRRESACERSRDYYEAPPPHFEHVVPSRLAATPPPPPAPPQQAPPTHRHGHNFLTIKQEPTDWSTNPPNASSANNNNLEEGPLVSPKQPLDFKISAVKMEVNRDRGTPSEDSEEHTLRDYNNFKQLLVCEICQKSFEDTKMLVRHLGTHASDPAGGAGSNLLGPSASGSAPSASGNSSNLALRALKTYVPKKRRRVSQQENNMDHDHVTLLCDLCSTAFETPAEWVRHMNSQHTEIELAMFNSKKDGEQKGQQQQQQQQQPATSSSSTVSTSQMQPKYPSSTTNPTRSMLLNRSNNVDVAASAATSTSPGPSEAAATSSSSS